MSAVSNLSVFGGGIGIKSVPVRTILESERYKILQRRQSYYDCTQHDLKKFDFEGRIITSDSLTGAPSYSEKLAGFYVPLKMRRPSTPYRLGRAIVNSFTNLIFGKERFPLIRVEGDPKSHYFNQAVIKRCKLPAKMIRARNIGGATGTVGLSWAFLDGEPVVNVHNGKHLFVHEWEDRDRLIPAHVSETYIYPRDEFDNSKKRYTRKWYWYRRDWTKTADFICRPVEYKPGTEPLWVVDKIADHNDGLCKFVWIQNLPCEEVDGLPDYEGVYESMDSLDVVNSVIVRGATLNLDPTLKLKMDADLVNRMGVKKGSDNALVTGEGGDASYLELNGSSISAGIQLFQEMRKAILESTNCVIVDPNEVAAQGLSSITLRALYSPMLGKCDVIREQYGTAIDQLLTQMWSVAKEKWKKPGDDGLEVAHEDEELDPMLEPDPFPSKQPVEQVLMLPPMIIKKMRDAGEDAMNPYDDYEISYVELEPGDGGDIEVMWPPYFSPTPDDQAKTASTLAVATGNAPFMSDETAVEINASMYGLQGDEEKRRLALMMKKRSEAEQQMFADQNGGMGGTDGEQQPQEQPPEAATLSLTSTDLAFVVTVNEARERNGLAKLTLDNGALDPDGLLTIAEYKAKRNLIVATAAKAEKGESVEDPPPPPPMVHPGFGGPPGAGGPPKGPPKPGEALPPEHGGPPAPPAPGGESPQKKLPFG